MSARECEQKNGWASSEKTNAYTFLVSRKKESIEREEKKPALSQDRYPVNDAKDKSAKSCHRKKEMTEWPIKATRHKARSTLGQETRLILRKGKLGE